jgi:hypothetical protein
MSNTGNNCAFFSYTVFHYLIEPILNQFLFSGSPDADGSEEQSSGNEGVQIGEEVKNCLNYIKTVLMMLKGSLLRLFNEDKVDDVIRIYFHIFSSDVGSAIQQAKGAATDFVKYIQGKISPIQEKIARKLANFIEGSGLNELNAQKARLNMCLFHTQGTFEILGELAVIFT